MRGAEAFRPFYEAARVAWPIFPANVAILEVTTPNGAECKGIVGGVLTFWIDPNYVITDIIGFHECGHAFEALLEARGVSKDRVRTLLWQFRMWTGTWQQQDAYANTLSGGERWQNLPVEIVAETWRCGHVGPPSEERTVYLGPLDHAAQRAFYESLQQEAGVAVTDYPAAIWKGSPNRWTGRAFGPPQYIVDHWTTVVWTSAVNTFLSSSSGVSAHYLVCRDGTVYQFVREQDTAWHDGYDPDGYGPLPGWNHISIGIEHEGWPGSGWTAAQIAASAALHRDIERRRGIPLNRDHVLGHNDTGYATACPGDLPIDTIIGGDDLAADPAILAAFATLTAAVNANTDKVGALANSIMVWMDREQRGADVVSGGPDPQATKP